MSLPRGRRYVAFACAAIGLSVLVTLGALAAVDVYLHRKFERISGYNVWGYRGPVVPAKAPGERRVVVLGGSTAFGYGVRWEDSFATLLEPRLADAWRRPVRVVNLAWNSEGAHSFAATLADYRYLGHDVAILYEGYNDLAGSGSNTQVFRRESLVFQLTGYLPIFPIVFTEKALALRHGGDLTAAYRNLRGEEAVVFQPGFARRVTASALETASGLAYTLERRLGAVTEAGRARAQAMPAAECPAFWAAYCAGVEQAVTDLVAAGKHTIVVTQPYIADRHVEQQRALAAMLARRFPGHPLVHYVNLGDVLNLKDPAFAFDGMHLTAAGNRRIAEALAPAVARVVP